MDKSKNKKSHINTSEINTKFYVFSYWHHSRVYYIKIVCCKYNYVNVMKLNLKIYTE